MWQFSINGQRSNANYFMVDGVTASFFRGFPINQTDLAVSRRIGFSDRFSPLAAGSRQKPIADPIVRADIRFLHLFQKLRQKRQA